MLDAGIEKGKYQDKRKNAKRQKRLDKKERQRQVETIPFGETTHAPPIITVRPKKVFKTNSNKH
jgi:hypothetical protein